MGGSSSFGKSSFSAERSVASPAFTPKISISQEGKISAIGGEHKGMQPGIVPSKATSKKPQFAPITLDQTPSLDRKVTTSFKTGEVLCQRPKGKATMQNTGSSLLNSEKQKLETRKVSLSQFGQYRLPDRSRNDHVVPTSREREFVSLYNRPKESVQPVTVRTKATVQKAEQRKTHPFIKVQSERNSRKGEVKPAPLAESKEFQAVLPKTVKDLEKKVQQLKAEGVQVTPTQTRELAQAYLTQFAPKELRQSVSLAEVTKVQVVKVPEPTVPLTPERAQLEIATKLQDASRVYQNLTDILISQGLDPEKAKETAKQKTLKVVSHVFAQRGLINFIQAQLEEKDGIDASEVVMQLPVKPGSSLVSFIRKQLHLDDTEEQYDEFRDRLATKGHFRTVSDIKTSAIAATDQAPAVRLVKEVRTEKVSPVDEQRAVTDGRG